METIAGLPRPDFIAPATLDGLLGLRGVIEMQEAQEDEAALAAAQADMLKGLDKVLGKRRDAATGRRFSGRVP